VAAEAVATVVPDAGTVVRGKTDIGFAEVLAEGATEPLEAAVALADVDVSTGAVAKEPASLEGLADAKVVSDATEVALEDDTELAKADTETDVVAVGETVDDALVSSGADPLFVPSMVMVHDLTSWTAGLPFASVIGVRVMTQVSVIIPATVFDW